jgi:hypothetical protein
MTKEKPILFSGAMVRAILDGRKTQTRRVIKGVPRWMHYGKDIMDWDLSGIHQAEEDNPFGRPEKKGSFYLEVQTDVDDNSRDEIFCPYGKPGDRLWVRETFMDEGAEGRNEMIAGFGLKPQYIYRATDSREPGLSKMFKWNPSIFMPRMASRLTLEVIGVRVERLQEISGEDALAEGIDNGSSNPTMGERWHNQQRMAFETLWDSINGKTFPWQSNPWVWVVEFKNISAELRAGIDS